MGTDASAARDALSLARGVTASITKASIGKRLRVGRVPSLDEMDSGRCPRCGRALPADLAFRPFMDRGEVRRDDELVPRCLIDGDRAGHREPLTADDVVTAAQVIADDLAAKGWTRWASVLGGALVVDGTARRVEAVGQTLEMFRRYAMVEIEKPATSDASPPVPLEILIVSSAAHWPAKTWADRGLASPGSAAAVAAGCTCPVDDNQGGAGWQLPDGTITWDVARGCPLHWPDVQA
jgi:hypothetical protein